MAFVHRKLLSSTLTIIITKPPCLSQLCFNFCSCKLPPPPPPPPPPHEHHLVPTGMTIMACVIVFFFILGIVCIVKYLKRIVSRRRNQPVVFLTRDDFIDEGHVPVIDHPIWLINFVGLQQSVIDSITACKYKRGEGLIEGTECSVCLGEFEEDEDLRLLPKCSHAFHLPCIDTWLRSHKNCPLCRAPVVGSTAAAASEPARIVPTPLEDSENDLDHQRQQVGEAVARIEIDCTTTPNIVQIRRNGPNGLLNGKSCDSRALGGLAENREMGLEGEVQVQPMRRCVSMDASSASLIYGVAKEHCNPDGAELGESKTKSFKKNPSKFVQINEKCFLHKGPVLMKRSCSSLDSTLPL